MEFKGKIVDMTKDFFTNRYRVTFSIEGVVPGFLTDKLEQGEDVRVKVTKYRERRSLDANAYYWVLIAKIAAKMHISKTFCHNLMLRRYGVPELWDDQILYVYLADTEKAEQQVNESETIHLKPTAQIVPGRDGLNRRVYITLKGSHDFDSNEMSVLINGVVDEAQQLGISTMSPEEVERLVSTWHPKASYKT